MDLSVSIEVVERRILLIRDQRVMIDSDLADLYGAATKRLNEQVKRNRERFPEDFMFQLTQAEKSEVVAKCDHLKNLKFSSKLPFAFTEHGALMAAGVLNTPLAIEVSIFIVRAFVRLRQMLLSHADLARKLDALEKKYDDNFKVVFEAIRALMAPPEKPKKKIGFGLREKQAGYGKKEEKTA
jgi:hypothetical protein